MIINYRKVIKERDFWLKFIIFSLLLFLVTIIFWHKTELSSSDLGRHIENGKLVFSQPDLLFTNFYSYTEPNFRFINHHWLGGVIYNFIYQIGSFKLLSIFNILLALVTFSLFFFLAKKKSNFYIASLFSLPAIFLFSERVEVRPEMFSYLFFIITWLVSVSKWPRKKKLFTLVPLFIIWANTHIYFFLGVGLVFLYVLNKILSNSSWRDFKSIKLAKKKLFEFKKEIFFFFILLLTAFVTPNHIYGFFYPLNILREYGYEIVENKSIFFLDDLMLNYNFLIFKLSFLTLVISFFASYIIEKKKEWFNWILALIVSLLAFFMSRNLALFGLVFLVLASASWKTSFDYIFSYFSPFNLENIKLSFFAFYVIILISTSIFLLTDLNNRQMFLSKDPGLGLTTSSLDAFEFYKENKLSGPIFNNYDVGSALIFGLEDEKVFVDNRPEAYSVDFFQEVYIPMQENKSVWEEELEKYDFNTIIFGHGDSTYWSKTFLNRILRDDSWALIYFDRYYVILVRKDVYPFDFVQSMKISDNYFRERLREISKKETLNGKFALANLAQAKGAPYLAQEIYKEILVSSPSNYQNIFSLAYLYTNSPNINDRYKAIEYFKKGLELAPKMPGIYNKIALTYWDLGEYDKAEEYWRKSLKVNGKSKEVKDYLNQVEFLKKQGRIK